MSLESRVELILQNILGASNEVDPESRVEKLLQNLIEVAYIVDPMSRVELLLENLQGGSNEVVPMSRVEMLIANALGATYDVTPMSRVEELLVLLAEEYATVYKTVTGAIATFDDAVPNEPLKSLVVDINPVQDLSQGDPSPENICPISGWEGVNVRRCNENLWDDAWYSLGNIMTLIDNETSNFYGYYWGSVKSWASAQVSSGITKMFPDGVDELTVTAELGNISASANFTFRIWFYYADGTEGYSGNIVVASLGKKTETKKSEAGKKCIGFGISTSAGTGNPNGCVKNIMVSVNGVTDFVEPVQNPLIPINWQTEAGAVYGGRLNVLSGVMRVTWRYFDGGDVTWTKVDSYNYGNFYVNTSPLSTYYTTIPSVKSSAYKSESNQSALSSADSYVWIRSISAGNRRVYVKDTSKASMTAEEFRTAMTGVQFVYELAEPIEIQLTPHEVRSLLGQNNIWADTGDVTVEYKAYANGG